MMMMVMMRVCMAQTWGPLPFPSAPPGPWCPFFNISLWPEGKSFLQIPSRGAGPAAHVHRDCTQPADTVAGSEPEPRPGLQDMTSPPVSVPTPTPCNPVMLTSQKLRAGDTVSGGHSKWLLAKSSEMQQGFFFFFFKWVISRLGGKKRKQGWLREVCTV